MFSPKAIIVALSEIALSRITVLITSKTHSGRICDRVFSRCSTKHIATKGRPAVTLGHPVWREEKMSKKQKRIFWPTILIALVACGALVSVAARAKTATEPRTAASSVVTAGVVTAEAAVPQAAPDKPARGDIKAVLLTLRPEGFEPKRIKRPAGKAVLVVTNRSELPDAVLRLDRVGAKGEERMKKSKRNWIQLVDLEPGNYQLSVADHPDWVCQITITAR